MVRGRYVVVLVGHLEIPGFLGPSPLLKLFSVRSQVLSGPARWPITICIRYEDYELYSVAQT